MLRTLRFAAKLNFSIDEAILIFYSEMTQLLRDVSPHRLYDESQKLFTMGHLNRVLPMLIDFGIWRQLFADIKPDITAFIELAAKNTDQRISIGKTINPAFFYAVLLWQLFLERCDFYLSKGSACGSTCASRTGCTETSGYPYCDSTLCGNFHS